jgi:hypothetical protein
LWNGDPPRWLISISESFLLLMLWSHQPVAWWASHCDHHCGCLFDHFQTLCHFLTCCSLIILSPYTLMKWQGISVVETCFAHRNQITLWTSAWDQVSSVFTTVYCWNPKYKGVLHPDSVDNCHHRLRDKITFLYVASNFLNV